MKKQLITLLSLTIGLLTPSGSLFAKPEAEENSKKSTHTMKEIVVVATREEQEIMKIPGHVTVITEEKIKRSTAKDITQLLRTEAGMMVTNTSGSTHTGVFIEARGFNNGGGNGGRTLVVMDGQRMNQADTSNADWALIPLHNIKRIEIIRGPATAIYGDTAMAAVISITTKDGKGEPKVNVDADAGSWDRYGQRISLQGANERFSYFIYGDNMDEGGYRDNSKYQANNLSGKFSYQLNSRLELKGKLGYHDDSRELPGSLTADEIIALGRRASVASTDELNAEQFNTNLGLNYFHNDNHNLSLDLFYNNTKGDSLTTMPGSGSTTIEDKEEDYNFVLRYTCDQFLWGHNNKAILGIDYIKEEITSSSYSNFPPWFIQDSTTGYERDIIGIYLHDDFSITDKTILSFGMRYDHADLEYDNITRDYVAPNTTTQSGKKNFEQWNPKAALTHLINENVSAYVSYAKSFRFPNRDELTGFLGLTPELDPEKADNYELGLKVDLGDNIKGTVALYHMEVEDEILYAPPEIDTFGFGQNENFDEIRHRGLEISFESNLIPRTTLIGSYTYTETEIKTGTFSGSELPITPRHKGHIIAIIDLGKGFSLWNQARFVGKRYLANDLSNSFTRLPAFEVWDVKLTYQHDWKNVDLSIFAGVNNVLDEEYEEFGGVGGYQFGSRIGVNPSPERNFLGGITVSWNFQ